MRIQDWIECGSPKDARVTVVRAINTPVNFDSLSIQIELNIAALLILHTMEHTAADIRYETKQTEVAFSIHTLVFEYNGHKFTAVLQAPGVFENCMVALDMQLLGTNKPQIKVVGLSAVGYKVRCIVDFLPWKKYPDLENMRQTRRFFKTFEEASIYGDKLEKRFNRLSDGKG